MVAENGCFIYADGKVKMRNILKMKVKPKESVTLR